MERWVKHEIKFTVGVIKKVLSHYGENEAKDWLFELQKRLERQFLEEEFKESSYCLPDFLWDSSKSFEQSQFFTVREDGNVLLPKPVRKVEEIPPWIYFKRIQKREVIGVGLFDSGEINFEDLETFKSWYLENSPKNKRFFFEASAFQTLDVCPFEWISNLGLATESTLVINRWKFFEKKTLDQALQFGIKLLPEEVVFRSESPINQISP